MFVCGKCHQVLQWRSCLKGGHPISDCCRFRFILNATLTHVSIQEQSIQEHVQNVLFREIDHQRVAGKTRILRARPGPQSITGSD